MSITVSAYPAAIKRVLRHSTSINAYWVLASSVTSRIMSLLAFMFIARAIGGVDFGKLQVVITSIAVPTILAQAGMSVAVTKYISEWYPNKRERIRRLIALGYYVSLSFGLLISLLSFGLSKPLATLWYRDASLSQPLGILSASLLFTSLIGVQTGILSGLNRFRAVGISMTASAVVTIPLLVFLSYAFGLTGAVLGICLQAAIGSLVGEYYVRSALKQEALFPLWSEASMECSAFLHCSLPSMMSGLLVSPANWLAVSLLVTVHNGYSEMALYGAANQWRQAILFVPTAMNSVLIARLSNLHGLSASASFARTFRISILAILAASLLALAAVALAAPYILRGYGSDFEGGAAVLILLCLSAVIISINNMFSRAVASLDKMWVSFSFDVVWSASFLGASYLMIPSKGALGMAYAANIAAIVQLLFQVLSWKHLRRVSGIAHQHPSQRHPVLQHDLGPIELGRHTQNDWLEQPRPSAQ